MQRFPSPTVTSLALAAALSLAACSSDSDDPVDAVTLANDVPGSGTDVTMGDAPDADVEAPTEVDADAGTPTNDGLGADAPLDGTEELETRVRTEIETFIATVDGVAANPVPAPDLLVETTESLIAYGRFDDTGEGIVIVPRWEDLGEEQALFESWGETTGGAFDGQRLFDELFGWFFVVHEVGHHLQAESDRGPASPWDEELQANEIAVAYFGATDRARLDALVPAMRAVRDSLEVPEGAGDRDYFDREYESLEGPLIYGYFQFDFVIDAYERIDTLDLATIVRDDLAL